MQKFTGQGSNPCHSGDPSCCSDNTRSLATPRHAKNNFYIHWQTKIHVPCFTAILVSQQWVWSQSGSMSKVCTQTKSEQVVRVLRKKTHRGGGGGIAKGGGWSRWEKKKRGKGGGGGGEKKKGGGGGADSNAVALLGRKYLDKGTIHSPGLRLRKGNQHLLGFNTLSKGFLRKGRRPELREEK